MKRRLPRILTLVSLLCVLAGCPFGSTGNGDDCVPVTNGDTITKYLPEGGPWFVNVSVYGAHQWSLVRPPNPRVYMGCEQVGHQLAYPGETWKCWATYSSNLDDNGRTFRDGTAVTVTVDEGPIMLDGPWTTIQIYNKQDFCVYLLQGNHAVPIYCKGVISP